MTTEKSVSIPELTALIGKELGVSDWIPIEQEHIDAFAHLTGDHQFIHVDPERAKTTSFGTTIAHGFLVMSLVPRMSNEVLPHVQGTKMAMNYGSNKLRFLSPVKQGARVRGRFKQLAVENKGDGRIISTVEVTIDIDGEKKPALILEWLIMIFL